MENVFKYTFDGLMILLLFGFLCGVVQTVCQECEDGCGYHSFFDFNPGRVIACEFLRKRW